MRILAIGGYPVLGYGVPHKKGFMEVFAESLIKLEQAPVKVDYYIHFSMENTIELLLNIGMQIHRYDLIIMQLGHSELFAIDTVADLRKTDKQKYNENSLLLEQLYVNTTEIADNLVSLRELYKPSTKVLSTGLVSQLKWRVKLHILKQMYKFGKLGRLKYYRRLLKVILSLLTQVKERCVVVSPFPCINSCHNYLRTVGRTLTHEECVQQAFHYLPSENFIEHHPYFFQPDGLHINALGHRVLASQLLKFYRQEIRKHPYFFQLCSN